MRFDDELAELAALLRVGAETARAIAKARGRDEAAILDLAAQADGMAVRVESIVGAANAPAFQPPDTLRLKRDR